jgi:hypothetical protein
MAQFGGFQSLPWFLNLEQISFKRMWRLIRAAESGCGVNAFAAKKTSAGLILTITT